MWTCRAAFLVSLLRQFCTTFAILIRGCVSRQIDASAAVLSDIPPLLRSVKVRKSFANAPPEDSAFRFSDLLANPSRCFSENQIISGSKLPGNWKQRLGR